MTMSADSVSNSKYPGLTIYRDGRIQGPSGKILKPCPDSNGYMFITHCPGSRTGQKRRKIHILVCETFHGPRPGPGYQVAHWDGDKSNNSAANLRWATASENGMDKIHQDRHTRGVRNGSAKLTEGEVRQIRDLDHSPMTKIQIGKAYGVSDGMVGFIIRRKAWGWLV
jgi:hypothetical protein